MKNEDLIQQLEDAAYAIWCLPDPSDEDLKKSADYVKSIAELKDVDRLS